MPEFKIGDVVEVFVPEEQLNRMKDDLARTYRNYMMCETGTLSVRAVHHEKRNDITYTLYGLDYTPPGGGIRSRCGLLMAPNRLRAPKKNDVVLEVDDG